ncbi:hypothetical protein [Alicyclobacillus sp. SO9]|uniref:hypothetical protein n=1 Tax=Alicyclobacillus sp. SO9 TaxID=2665646 RepID=UPI0018E8888F|nr:hypothetical protein [Alicyclobacillus sp. SO9]QQE78092.1 hypothetical protein GI364_19700 [Alicyclobacillus sp. SO9]
MNKSVGKATSQLAGINGSLALKSLADGMPKSLGFGENDDAYILCSRRTNELKKQLKFHLHRSDASLKSNVPLHLITVVKETQLEREANSLLSDGWILIGTFTSTYDPMVAPQHQAMNYVLGKLKSDEDT